MRLRRPPTLTRVLGRELHCSKRRIKVGDKHLDPISSAQMSEFLVYDKTDELKWKEEVQDCDNFALYLRANAKKWFERQGINAAVATIWTYPTRIEVAHAFNFYLLPILKVVYIEPQTDMERFLNARVNFVII